MNSEHVINGWIAQLSLDARDRGAGGSRRAALAVASPAPVGPAVPAVSADVPSRARARRRPVQVWAREGRRRPAVGGPCLGLV